MRVVGEAQKTLTGFFKHPVADTVPVKIVDRLEPVEVEHADDKAAVRGDRLLRQHRQPMKELAPVGKLGQAVDIGETKVLVAEAPGLDLRIDHRSELTGADDQDVDHRDRDKE